MRHLKGPCPGSEILLVASLARWAYSSCSNDATFESFDRLFAKYRRKNKFVSDIIHLL